MEERLKRRLIGGAVLVSLVVIFVPMMLEERVVTERSFAKHRIPQQPSALQRPPDPKTILPEPIVRKEASVSAAEVEVEAEPQAAESAIPAKVQRYGKIERDTPKAWMIQVASFSKRQNAEKLVERLNKADMPAQVKQVKVGGKQRYRVQMFPQLDKQQAENLVKKIRRKFGLEASVVRYAG